MCLGLAQNAAASATSSLFADISKAPAVQILARRLENGGVLTCAGVSQAAQPFFAVLLRKIFQRRPIVVVTDNLKTQESFQQDLETWLSSGRESRGEGRGQNGPGSRPSTFDLRPFFYPAWDVLPHEGKLPHADTISDRLQTLVQLSGLSTLNCTPNAPARDSSEFGAQLSTLVVTSVTALL